MRESLRSRLDRSRLSEAELRELEVIDLATSQGATSQPEDAELIDFALRIKGARPIPDQAAVNRIDARVAELPYLTARPNAPARRRSPRKLVAVGVAAFLLLGAAAVSLNEMFPRVQGLSGEIGSDDRGDMAASTPNDVIGPTSADPAAEESQQDMAREKSGSLEEFMQRRQSLRQTQSTARVETRNAELTLAAPVDEVEKVSDDVIAITDRYGGYVNQSSVRGGDSDVGAALELMIPASDYQAALTSISALGNVRERVQNTADITAPYKRAETELERAIRNRDRLSRQRANATTDAERSALTIRLRRANRVVAAERREFNAIERQASFVAMSVTVVGDDAAASADESTVEAAWNTAKDLLSTILGVLIIALAVLLPLLLIGGVIYLGYRGAKRSRSDRAIDSGVSTQSPAQTP